MLLPLIMQYVITTYIKDGKNSKLHDLQRTSQCENTSTTSDTYIWSRLQFLSRSSIERSNSTRTTTRRDQPRSVWRLSGKRLHFCNIPEKIKDRHFNPHLYILCKLWQRCCILLWPHTNVNCKSVRKEIRSVQ